MNTQYEPQVLTPYYYSVLNISPEGCTEQEANNYNEYNLFCLRTRLVPFLSSQGWGHLSVTFPPIQRGKRMVIGLYLTNAGQKAEFLPREIEKLERKVTEITTVKPEYCILYSSDIPVYYKMKRIPSAWVLSVLPYILIDEHTNPYVDGTHLYVNLSRYGDYNIRYNQMYSEISKILKDYYSWGGVVCNDSFAQKWQLAPYISLGFETIDNVNQLLTDEEIRESTDGNGLYLPTWINNHFAPDRVLFLLERMAGETIIKIKISSLLGQRASLGEYLKDYTFYINDNLLIIEDMKSLGEIQKLVNNLTLLPTPSVVVSPVSVGPYTWKDLSGNKFLATKI